MTRKDVIEIAGWVMVMALVITMCVIFLLSLTSCSTTVVPRELVANRPSYDGTTPDSGIITSLPGEWIITPERLATYNSLIAVYGSQFSPPLKPNAGITHVGPNICIDDEHDVDQKLMETWKSSGTHAPKTLIQKAGLP